MRDLISSGICFVINVWILHGASFLWKLRFFWLSLWILLAWEPFGDDDDMAARSSTSNSDASTSGSSGGSRSPCYIEHKVSKLDTLAGVAIKYGVEVRMNWYSSCVLFLFGWNVYYFVSECCLHWHVSLPGAVMWYHIETPWSWSSKTGSAWQGREIFFFLHKTVMNNPPAGGILQFPKHEGGMGGKDDVLRKWNLCIQQWIVQSCIW